MRAWVNVSVRKVDSIVARRSCSAVRVYEYPVKYQPRAPKFRQILNSRICVRNESNKNCYFIINQFTLHMRGTRRLIKERLFRYKKIDP